MAITIGTLNTNMFTFTFTGSPYDPYDPYGSYDPYAPYYYDESPYYDAPISI